MDKTAGIWETLVRVIGHDIILLEVTAAVVVYRERGSDEVLAKKIARHSPPLRPWGVEFRACGTPDCHPRPQDLYVQSNDFDVRMNCRSCGWLSVWVKERHWKNRVFRLDRTLPNVFWHDYPAPKSLENIFVDATREVIQAGAGSAPRKW